MVNQDMFVMNKEIERALDMLDTLDELQDMVAECENEEWLNTRQ